MIAVITFISQFSSHIAVTHKNFLKRTFLHSNLDLIFTEALLRAAVAVKSGGQLAACAQCQRWERVASWGELPALRGHCAQACAPDPPWATLCSTGGTLTPALISQCPGGCLWTSGAAGGPGPRPQARWGFWACSPLARAWLPCRPQSCCSLRVLHFKMR